MALSSLIAYYLVQMSEARIHQEIKTATADLREVFVNNLKGQLYGAMGLFWDSREKGSGTATEENDHEYGTATGMDADRD